MNNTERYASWVVTTILAVAVLLLTVNAQTDRRRIAACEPPGHDGAARMVLTDLLNELGYDGAGCLRDAAHRVRWDGRRGWTTHYVTDSTLVPKRVCIDQPTLIEKMQEATGE